MSQSEDELIHYGIIRRSGRYPWGSGGWGLQGALTFMDNVNQKRAEGMSETDIAKAYGITTTDLRAYKSIATNAIRADERNRVQRLVDKGYSNVKIGEMMGKNESSIRSIRADLAKDKADILKTTSDMLRKQVDEKGYVDVGAGVSNQIGVTNDKLAVSLAMLRAEGYEVHTAHIEQLGTGHNTTLKVLTKPDTTLADVYQNRDKIRQIQEFSEDGGRTFSGLVPPKSVDSSRVAVRYAEDGGTDADGVIYVRPGVEDVSLGGSQYAQVRILVDGNRYLKGMAVYKDDLPDGVDLQFNTNKTSTGNKLDAMKKISDDPDNPFGSMISRQITTTDSSGKQTATSAINIVNEEGDWGEWSKTISTQVLSKQRVSLAENQLKLTYENAVAELDEIKALTNPVVKQRMLEAYADQTDSAAVHLKAASMKGQGTHVILPVNSLKETEIYAPNYRDGDRVALIRYPHGGTFEIPELTVNNRQPDARGILGNAPDAVGINSKVAERLSGADFDGDTVLVIPNNSRSLKTSPPLEGLKGFDPQRAYPAYEGMKPMTPRAKQQQMGDVSNLITDMTIRGAPHSDIARAVRHSMVVIDAEKHNLNYRQSAIDNGISQLKEKYQGGANRGASTLISRATSEARVPERRLRRASEGGSIDPDTGELQYVNTGGSYIDYRTGKTVAKTSRGPKLGFTNDAHTLTSRPNPTQMERVYADHSNRMKALANQARKEMVNTSIPPASPSAKKAYRNEVVSLDAKLNVAKQAAPRERQAQLTASTIVNAKMKANPSMDKAEIKKLKAQTLNEQRARLNSKKEKIDITPKEWEAIQSNAVPKTKLRSILDHTDLDTVKKYATPRTPTVMTDSRVARAKAMLNAGYTQAEVAQTLGVPTSTLNSSLGR